MRHSLCIAGGEQGLEIFRWSDGRLAQAIRETPETRSQVGAVYLGRVVRIEPSLNAAFVEIGLDRPGLLPLKKHGAQPTEGAAIAVQVRRDEHEGKAVRLSATIHSEVAYAEALAQAKGRVPACLMPSPPARRSSHPARRPPAPDELISSPRLDAGAVQPRCRQPATAGRSRAPQSARRDSKPD